MVSRFSKWYQCLQGKSERQLIWAKFEKLFVWLVSCSVNFVVAKINKRCMTAGYQLNIWICICIWFDIFQCWLFPGLYKLLAIVQLNIKQRFKHQLERDSLLNYIKLTEWQSSGKQIWPCVVALPKETKQIECNIFLNLLLLPFVKDAAMHFWWSMHEIKNAVIFRPKQAGTSNSRLFINCSGRSIHHPRCQIKYRPSPSFLRFSFSF